MGSRWKGRRPVSMLTSDHPPKDLLHAFGLGRLDFPAAAVVEEHLNHCGDCCECLNCLPADAFVAGLRDALYVVEQVPHKGSSFAEPYQPASDFGFLASTESTLP